MKVRLLEQISRELQNHLGIAGKPGEIVEVSHKQAIYLEAHGFAEFVHERRVAEPDPPANGSAGPNPRIAEAIEFLRTKGISEKEAKKIVSKKGGIDEILAQKAAEEASDDHRDEEFDPEDAT